MYDHSDLTEALAYIDPTTCDYETWVNVGMALHESGLPCSVWDAWSAKDAARYHDGECAKKWRTFGNSPTPVKSGTIVAIAERNGWVPIRHANNMPDEAFGWDDELPIVDPAYIDGTELPENVTGGDWQPVRELIEYLRALFEDTDHVCYVAESWQGDDGKRHPKKGDWSRTAGELIAELEKTDDVAKVIGDWDESAGVWICHNPVDGKGRSNANVTAYRYVLVESDEDTPERQLALMKALNLPLRAVVSSGNKSIHGIVDVGADTMDEYRKRVNRIYEECNRAGMHVDGANRNPSRLSRMPSVTRNGNRQALIATNIGAKDYESWADWIAEERDELPETIDLLDAMQDPPPLADALIDGILRKGHKMLLAAPSKAGKSFALMELAIAVAEGGTWLGHACKQGKVLYVNLEIDGASSIHRFIELYKALGIVAEGRNIDVWNLRGKACPMDKLAPRLIHRAAKKGKDPAHGGYSLIIIDPIYKILTGDENSASDMGAFCNEFDKVCTELGCSVVYCHHHSKGFKGTARSYDRMSGSGVFARDPDAILDMTATVSNGEQLGAVRDSAAVRVIDECMAGHGIIVPPQVRNVAKVYASWAVRQLDRAAGDELNARLVHLLEDTDTITTWRVSYTLREFPPMQPTNCWFDYPLHVPDSTGILDGTPYDGEDVKTNDGSGKTRKEATQDKHDELLEAFVMTSGLTGGDSVHVSEIAGYLGVSEKTVRRRLKQTQKLVVDGGLVCSADTMLSKQLA